jgi:hypothetical protein
VATTTNDFWHEPEFTSSPFDCNNYAIVRYFVTEWKNGAESYDSDVVSIKSSNAPYDPPAPRTSKTSVKKQ